MFKQCRVVTLEFEAHFSRSVGNFTSYGVYLNLTTFGTVFGRSVFQLFDYVRVERAAQAGIGRYCNNCDFTYFSRFGISGFNIIFKF